MGGPSSGPYMSETLDDTLMATLASGETTARERAFRELVRLHATSLTRFVRYLERDPQVVEDVVQDAFLRVYQARERYEPGKAPFRTWLVRIARNLTLDVQRKRARRGLEALGEHEAPAPSGMGPVRQLVGQQQAEAVREAVGRLAPPDREALLLRFDEQLSHGEIAEVMETTTAAIKQRLFRARGKLRELLEENG